MLRWAKARGIAVTAEVTPHHLLLTTDEVLGYDPTYKVNPPLRPDEHVEALRDALADGTIDAVATDHAPHARHDKEHAFAEAAFGMLGLETALAVVLETMVQPGRLDWADVARVLSTTPGRDRPAPRTGPPARIRRAREPGADRPERADDRGPGDLVLAVAEQPVARARAPGPGGRDLLARPADLPPLGQSSATRPASPRARSRPRPGPGTPGSWPSRPAPPARSPQRRDRARPL